MHAFDLLAEAKMRQWQQDVSQGKDQPSDPGRTFSKNDLESFERRLYRQIREAIVRSHLAPPDQRQPLLDQAQAMQVQLAARLESSGYYRISRLFADEIQAMRLRAQALDQDKPGLAALLREVEDS